MKGLLNAWVLELSVHFQKIYKYKGKITIDVFDIGKHSYIFSLLMQFKLPHHGKITTLNVSEGGPRGHK